MTFCCLNGKLLKIDEAKLSPFDNGFLYGDGIYDTMRSYKGKILELDLHMARIKKSADQIGITLPWNLDEIQKWSMQLADIHKEKDMRVRVTITRGEHGFDFSKNPSQPTLFITVEAIDIPKSIYTKGVTAETQVLHRIMHGIKTLGLTHMIIAYRYAAQKKLYEIILIDKDGTVREGASTNLFVIRNNIIYTPKNKILPGLTRARIITLARKNKIKVVVKDFNKKFLQQADEIFLSNRPREVIPVTTLNSKNVGDGTVGSITKQIMKFYTQYVKSSL